MTQLVIKIDNDMAKRLDELAPAHSRRRAAVLRAALRRALWDLEEQATAAAYRRRPDRERDAYLNPDVWDQQTRPKRERKRR